MTLGFQNDVDCMLTENEKCDKVACIYVLQPITEEDITGYQVYYNGTMMNVNSSTTTLTFTAPSLPDGVFTGTVVVMVTAVNKFGVGPTSDPAYVTITGTTSYLIFIYTV